MADDLNVTFDGNPVTLRGTPLEVGDSAPGFRVVRDLAEAVDFGDVQDQSVHVITSSLSVDTPTCAEQFQEFDRRARGLQDEGIDVWYISRDLPFALQRFADQNNITRANFFSDYQFDEFGDNFGLVVDAFDLLARATYVVDTDGEVTYREIVPEIGDEPDYDAALDAAREVA